MNEKDPPSSTAVCQSVHDLSVQIVEFVDESFPGWVKCEFVDAEGYRHEFVDKYPIFSIEMLDADSSYPTPGSVRCKVLTRWQDSQGRELASVSTASPDGVESTEGKSEFVILSELLHRSA